MEPPSFSPRLHSNRDACRAYDYRHGHDHRARVRARSIKRLYSRTLHTILRLPCAPPRISDWQPCTLSYGECRIRRPLSARYARFLHTFADTAPAINSSCTRPDCRPGDYLYSTDDTLVQTYTIGNGIMVSDFCTSSDRARCASTGDLSSLDIVFARPNRTHLSERMVPRIVRIQQRVL